jgi:hypothetical protein
MLYVNVLDGKKLKKFVWDVYAIDTDFEDEARPLFNELGIDKNDALTCSFLDDCDPPHNKMLIFESCNTGCNNLPMYEVVARNGKLFYLSFVAIENNVFDSVKSVYQKYIKHKTKTKKAFKKLQTLKNISVYS